MKSSTRPAPPTDDGNKKELEGLLRRLKERSPVPLNREELASLLEAARLVREVNTGVAGTLRVLVVDQTVVVQEETPKRDILLRSRSRLEEAVEFVDRRLALYERMWDG
jgi:hypothetical protein